MTGPPRKPRIVIHIGSPHRHSGAEHADDQPGHNQGVAAEETAALAGLHHVGEDDERSPCEGHGEREEEEHLHACPLPIERSRAAIVTAETAIAKYPRYFGSECRKSATCCLKPGSPIVAAMLSSWLSAVPIPISR